MTGPIRVLYVDDSRLDRELVRDALSRDGVSFDLTAAGNRQEFETCLGRDRYDVILSDFNILGFQGLQVIDEVRSRKLATPVVIVTGTGSEEVAVEAMKRGAADYVLKTPSHIQRLPLTIQNVLERKQLEEENFVLERRLEQSQRLESLGVLAGGIAHDFNNLLTGVTGYLGLALHELSALPGAEQTSVPEFLREVERIVHRAADLCRQMLAFSGKGSLVVGPVNLAVLLREAEPLLRHFVEPKCELSVESAAGLPALSGDPTQIHQLVMNLVINAAEAMGDKPGKIAVRAGTRMLEATLLAQLQPPRRLAPGEHVFLEVADNGPGMTAEVVAKVFDPFFTTKVTGRGLGLAVVLGIVRGMGGALHLETTPGSGTTFSMYFPPAA